MLYKYARLSILKAPLSSAKADPEKTYGSDSAIKTLILKQSTGRPVAGKN